MSSIPVSNECDGCGSDAEVAPILIYRKSRGVAGFNLCEECYLWLCIRSKYRAEIKNGNIVIQVFRRNTVMKGLIRKSGQRVRDEI